MDKDFAYYIRLANTHAGIARDTTDEGHRDRNYRLALTRLGEAFMLAETLDQMEQVETAEKYLRALRCRHIVAGL
ncbi:hypothetical protein SEA_SCOOBYDOOBYDOO_139 [Mycobacterium phage ScoobyDoobyDoo]|nr:hypothetical protein SEA_SCOOBYDOOBYDOO_139 [Mycobacterium phage ScoobyDoobyDoo]